MSNDFPSPLYLGNWPVSGQSVHHKSCFAEIHSSGRTQPFHEMLLVCMQLVEANPVDKIIKLDIHTCACINALYIPVPGIFI